MPFCMYIYGCVYTHIPCLHYPFMCWWMLKLLIYLENCINAPVNIGMHVFFKISVLFFFSLDIYTIMELLGRMVVLYLVFRETSILFSTVAAPVYIPTNSVGGFFFLHTFTNICYSCSFWWQAFWQVCGDILLWF